MGGLPTVVGRYLSLLDAELPGVVEAVYITASPTTGEVQPQPRDIDFVAVTEHALGERERAHLAALHDRLHRAHPSPPLEGVYATWDELGSALDELPALPTLIVGQRGLQTVPTNPVTWLNLKLCDLRLRGRGPRSLPISDDLADLRDWSMSQLTGYWSAWLRDAHRPTRIAASTLRTMGVVWSVTGAGRALYTLATGELGSRTDAMTFVRERVDSRSQRVIDEALRLRAGAPDGHYANRRARRADVLRFVSLAIRTADGWGALAEQPPADPRRMW
jgi:hypothetical protein